MIEYRENDWERERMRDRVYLNPKLVYLKQRNNSNIVLNKSHVFPVKSQRVAIRELGGF